MYRAYNLSKQEKKGTSRNTHNQGEEGRAAFSPDIDMDRICNPANLTLKTKSAAAASALTQTDVGCSNMNPATTTTEEESSARLTHAETRAEPGAVHVAGFRPALSNSSTHSRSSSRNSRREHNNHHQLERHLATAFLVEEEERPPVFPATLMMEADSEGSRNNEEEQVQKWCFRCMVAGGIFLIFTIIVVAVVFLVDPDPPPETKSPITTLSPTPLPTATVTAQPTSTPTPRPAYIQYETNCGTYTSVCNDPNAIVYDTQATMIPGMDPPYDFLELPFAFNWFGDTVVTNVTVSVFGHIAVPGEGEINVFGWALEAFGIPTGSFCSLSTDSSVTVSWENVLLGAYATVSGQAEFFPNGNVHLRWGSLRGSEVPDVFSAGLSRPGEAFPCSGEPFGVNGTTWFDDGNGGASLQCRLFDAGYRTYSMSSTDCGSFTSIERMVGTVQLEEATACAMAVPSANLCTENISLPFSFPWFGDTNVTEISVASNGQLTIGTSLFATSKGESIAIGGSIRFPRVAVLNADLERYSLAVLYLPREDSAIISWEATDSSAVVNGQVELYINGTVEMRWGDAYRTYFFVQLAAGIEDDTRTAPEAFPVVGFPFENDGVAAYGLFPEWQCRRFTLLG